MPAWDLLFSVYQQLRLGVSELCRWQGRLTYQHGTRSAQFIKSAQENEKDSNRLSGGVGGG